MMVFCCVATGTVNVQVIETQDTDGIMTGFNRFFSEECVPKIVFPDKGSSLLKALEEMEGSTLDLEHRLSEERGIAYRACLPQGHSAHGRVERVIRSLQEGMEAAGLTKERLTATGWQTIAKGIENSYNNLPLGTYYRRSEENVSILRILTPNLLRGKLSSRSPKGLFEVERDIGKLLERTQNLYKAWYSIWNTIYLPQLILRPKWHESSEDLQVDHLVLFKKTESAISVEWVLGKVEQVRRGKDGRVRECQILYKSTGESDRMILVERPVREVIRLFNIEDTTFFEDLENARRLSQDILSGKVDNPDSPLNIDGNGDTFPTLSLQQEDVYVKQILELNLGSRDPSTQVIGHFGNGINSPQEDDLEEWLQDRRPAGIEDDPLYFA